MNHSTGRASRVLLVGNPNVGKSLLFNRLTGEYATVSNYPGTTVEVAIGNMRSSAGSVQVVDTPGIYSLSPISGEEKVTCTMLFATEEQTIVHVVDAKNLQRMLGLTLQLLETGLPVVLVLNMADEARAHGVNINVRALSSSIGIPVVLTTATTGEGIRELCSALERPIPRPARRIGYADFIEASIDEIVPCLAEASMASARSRAVLVLQQGDRAYEHIMLAPSGDAATRIARVVAKTRGQTGHSVQYHCAMSVKKDVDRLVNECVAVAPRFSSIRAQKIGAWLINPWIGWPVLFVVLYFGLYRFVGGFGAGTLVDLMEDAIFGQYLTPAVVGWTETLVPWAPLRELISGEYGVFTLAIRYAVGIVLPIVGVFFLAFAVLEDSGYLPRLALLIDGVLKRIGLNGRAVIPLVLGFGCGTMATMVTRTLETRRERLIAAILLSLAVPCSAQVGVIFGLLAGHPGAIAAWVVTISAIFLLVGSVSAKFMPGDHPIFYMELPPMRWPRPGNVASKTLSRMVWYVREIIPLFVLASVVIWIGQQVCVFDTVLAAIRPLVVLMGLPPEAATAFLFGFFRRDYGAAGLYDLHRTSGLTGNQLFVACLTLTLFLPCIAQWMVLFKEHGWKFAVAVGVGVMAVACGSGMAAHMILSGTGARL